MACEFSGRVREAFRSLGHDAWSCDLLPALDGSKRHLRCDVREVLGDGWDLMIAHPPCTYLTSAAAYLRKDKQRRIQMGLAIEFVKTLMDAPIPRVAVENPTGILSEIIGKPSQIIHPWMFGDLFKKRTCLWLKGLPTLVPTHCGLKDHAIGFVDSTTGVINRSEGTRLPRKLTRSMTFPGIARAMAEQWGGVEI